MAARVAESGGDREHGLSTDRHEKVSEPVREKAVLRSSFAEMEKWIGAEKGAAFGQ